MIGKRKRPWEETNEAAARNLKGAQPPRRHYGLYNQGNTCYLNSVLQVLFMTEEINDRLHPKLKQTDQELRNIFERMKEATCRTESITRCLDIKNVNQQRDAAECLEMILHKISPQVSEVFQGTLAYKTMCSRGHSINEETNPFWTLQLPLKDTSDAAYSVEKNFKRIFRTRKFSGDNLVYCTRCKRKTEASSECDMVESPQILTLVVKRFYFDPGTMSGVKSDCSVAVPPVLQTQNKKYKLYGIVNHMGNLRGGHYTAAILSNKDKTWYEFDDADVSKIEEQPFEKNRTYKYNSRTAYLLMYRASGCGREDEECVEQVRKERNREVPSHHGRGEEGEAKSEKKSSSFKKPEENVLLVNQKQNTSCTSKHHNDDWKKAEKREQRSTKGGENSVRPCNSPPDILKNPILIGCIVLGCIIIGVILVVVLV